MSIRSLVNYIFNYTPYICVIYCMLIACFSLLEKKTGWFRLHSTSVQLSNDFFVQFFNACFLPQYFLCILAFLLRITFFLQFYFLKYFKNTIYFFFILLEKLNLGICTSKLFLSLGIELLHSLLNLNLLLGNVYKNIKLVSTWILLGPNN